MDNFANWFGVGVKGGGSIGPGGFETMEGYISNLGMINHTHSINISYLRIGPGLGAGVGLSAIYVFNCRNPQSLHQKNDSSWGVNVSIGPKWSDIAKVLAKSGLLKIIPKAVSSITKLTRSELDDLRNIASYIYSACEIKDISRDKVMVIDIPLAGVGLELSAHQLHGTIFIGDLNMQETEIDRTGIPAGGRRRGEL